MWFYACCNDIGACPLMLVITWKLNKIYVNIYAQGSSVVLPFFCRRRFHLLLSSIISIYNCASIGEWNLKHDDVTKWNHFPRYWPGPMNSPHKGRGIHRGPMNSPHKGQWREALMFSLICAWINGCINNRDAGELRRHRAHYDVTVMRFNYITGVA